MDESPTTGNLTFVWLDLLPNEIHDKIAAYITNDGNLWTSADALNLARVSEKQRASVISSLNYTLRLKAGFSLPFFRCYSEEMQNLVELTQFADANKSEIGQIFDLFTDEVRHFSLYDVAVFGHIEDLADKHNICNWSASTLDAIDRILLSDNLKTCTIVALPYFIDMITRAQNLEKLEILLPSHDLAPSFLRKLNLCCARELTICCGPYPSDSMSAGCKFAYLAERDHFLTMLAKHFPVLRIKCHCVTSKVWDVIPSLPNLKEILLHCDYIPPDGIQMLRSIDTIKLFFVRDSVNIAKELGGGAVTDIGFQGADEPAFSEHDLSKLQHCYALSYLAGEFDIDYPGPLYSLYPIATQLRHLQIENSGTTSENLRLLVERTRNLEVLQLAAPVTNADATAMLKHIGGSLIRLRLMFLHHAYKDTLPRLDALLHAIAQFTPSLRWFSRFQVFEDDFEHGSAAELQDARAKVVILRLAYKHVMRKVIGLRSFVPLFLTCCESHIQAAESGKMDVC